MTLLRNDMIFDGKISDQGAHCARKALQRFLPTFERQYDELVGAYEGTINVDVQTPIDLKIDFKTDLIEMGPGVWHRAEFIRVWFEFPLGTNTRAWIYQPYGWHWGAKPYGQENRTMVELLISKHVKGVEAGKWCKIHVVNDAWGSSSTTNHYLRERGPAQ